MLYHDCTARVALADAIYLSARRTTNHLTCVASAVQTGCTREAHAHTGKNTTRSPLGCTTHALSMCQTPPKAISHTATP